MIITRPSLALAAAGLALLAGCGGGGGPGGPSGATVASVNAHSAAPRTPPQGGFRNVVSFGDSLSDAGAYTLAAYSFYSPTHGAKAPFTYPYYYGGQFTVNGHDTSNWTVELAHDLGLDLTPNLIGYDLLGIGTRYVRSDGSLSTDPAAAFCAFDSAPPGRPRECTNFAQGGARVAVERGIGHDQGALTYPVTSQLANYLQQFQSFRPWQLLTVFAGGNDVLAAFDQALEGFRSAVSPAAVYHPALVPTQGPAPDDAQGQGQSQGLSQLQAQAASDGAGAAGVVPAQRAFAPPTPDAVVQARATVRKAADDLAATVTTMLNHGARYLLVYTLPDASLTPFGRALDGTGSCDNRNPQAPCHLLSQLTKVFNQRLLDNLDGKAVKVVDSYALLQREIAQPAAFGFTNTSTPWCDSVLTQESSLLCNVETPAAGQGAHTGNLQSWLFADGLHPTPAGHRVLSAHTQQAMRGFGWAL